MKISGFSALMTIIVLGAGLFFGSPFAALLRSFATAESFDALLNRQVLVVVGTSLLTALMATGLAAVSSGHS